jgi:hypothetical protein
MALSSISGSFQKRLAGRKTLRKPKLSSSTGQGVGLKIETVSHVAQIALAIVAIFGYFYTVLPVYQKERLAEQVAEYEGIIKKQAPKIEESEKRLAQLEQERSRLTQDLQSIERQLSLARGEKNKIESQIQYMTFRYRLPDGTPATTPQQVRTAQTFELRRSFLSSLSMSCTFGLRGDVFPSYSSIKEDSSNKYWPFTDKEMATWKEFGSKYPLKRAVDCIDSVANDFLQRYAQDGHATDIDNLRKEAIQYANSAGVKAWVPPLEPADLLQELVTKRSAIESDMNAELKKVEEQYGDWESAFGESRRAILKHNYQVGKQNAKAQALSGQFSLSYSTQEKANAFRKSIHQEVKRLIISEAKGGSR